MKRIICFALVCIMTVCAISACTQKTADNVGENFVFTEENYPKMGGSLANLPLGEAITATVLDIDRE